MPFDSFSAWQKSLFNKNGKDLFRQYIQEESLYFIAPIKSLFDYPELTTSCQEIALC